MRSFIGIALPAAVRQEILTLQDILSGQLAGGYRFVKEPQLHLTLKFLGEVDERGLESIQQHLATIRAQHAPFRLSLRKLGSFGRPPRVLWLGLDGDKKKLYALQNAIAKEEDRSFQAHITLARVTRAPRGHHLHHYLETIKSLTPEPISWTVDAFILYRSELKSSGALHTPIAHYPLSGADTLEAPDPLDKETPLDEETKHETRDLTR